MPIITIVSGVFCHGEAIASHLAGELGARLVTDEDVLRTAAGLHGISTKDLSDTLNGRSGLLRRSAREKRRDTACLSQAIAESIGGDNVIHHGRTGHLLPRTVAHVLRICLLASFPHRVEVAGQEEGLSGASARKKIRSSDLELAEWTKFLFDKSPWDKTLYDLKLPMQVHSPAEAVAMILDHAGSEVVQPTAASRQALEDFRLAAKVDAILTRQGHDVGVTSASGQVTVEVNKYVVRFDHLRDRLENAAAEIDGVTSVKVLAGPQFRAGYLLDKDEFAFPAKVLLVDDEREFVHTLSERLQMRDIGTKTVYTGEQALEAIEQDEPEVMVLDLRMPGIDGIEVLRKVKQSRPHVEVIVLTGHGSSEDEALARELGAFAYIEKPVSIQRLTETLQAAYEKIRQRTRAAKQAEE
jgi:CheY-like chemotaxis protein